MWSNHMIITNSDGLSWVNGHAIGEFECSHKSIINWLLYVAAIQLLGLVTSVDYFDKVAFRIYRAYL